MPDCSRPTRPTRCGSTGPALRALTTDRLAEAFQVRPDNPLVGLDGRVALLRRLGDALTDPARRALFDVLTDGGPTRFAAHDILSQLLVSLSGIWLAENTIGDQPLGDCWRHPAVRRPRA